MKYPASLRRTSFIISAFALLCLIVLSVSAWYPSTTHYQNNPPEILNKTQSLQAISLVQNGDDFVLALKNNSNKPINGYSIAIGQHSKLTSDLTAGDRVIAHGEVAEEKIPISQLQVTSSGHPQRQQIIVLAVLFEDHSNEGDSTTISAIENRRLGVKQQLNRIYPLLESAASLLNSDKSNPLTKLKSQLSALPEEPEIGSSPYVRFGLREAKEDVLIQVQKLEQDNADIQEKVAKLRDKTKKRVDRLRKSIEKAQ